MDSYKVMTFNLRTSNGKDGENGWNYRKEAAVQMIREHSPLVVGVQEAMPDMLRDLESALEAYAWFGSGRLGGIEDEHNEHCAVFFKKAELELVEHGDFWLSESPERVSKGWDSAFPRICTWGRFRQRAGKEFVLFNTHLDHKGQLAREKGAALILGRLKEMRERSGLTSIVMGDFNSHPDNPAITLMRGDAGSDGGRAQLVDTFSVCTEDVGLTSHGFKGSTEGEPIDYIFVTPDIGIRSIAIDRRRLSGAYPSDHYPVVAELLL